MRIAGISRILLTVIVPLSSAAPVSAQMTEADSLFHQKAISKAVGLYRQSLGDQSGIFNGSQYPGYPFGFKDGGYPFFIKDAATGTILYHDVFYPSVRLLFDELAEVVVFEDSTHRIQLLGERIARFTIGDASFIRIVKDSGSSPLLATGFYQVLYDGRVTVFKKEVKKIKEELRFAEDGIIRSIEVKQYHYIKKNGVYYPVDNAKAVLAVYKDRKKELQQYIKANKLSFRKDRDYLLIKLSAWYDQLTK